MGGRKGMNLNPVRGSGFAEVNDLRDSKDANKKLK